MIIVDAHLDLAWNALQWNRDLTVSVHDSRLPDSKLPGPGRGQGTVALPEMRKGRVALCFATLLARSTGVMEPHLDYPTAAQAYGAAQGQLAWYHALESLGELRLIGDLAALDEHIAAWLQWDSAPKIVQPPLGLIISMESADPILHPNQLPEWWEGGVRIIGPAHYGPGRYAGGTSTELGLTALGRRLLPEMERLGILLDLTHLTVRGFWEALDLYDGLVLASHSNCRSLVPDQRQFDDAQIRAIAERDGVIGVALDAWMLRSGWIRGAAVNEPVRLADVADHVDHICQLTGSARHVAIGSDLDGGYGREQSPSDLDTIADLPGLGDELAARGYTKSEVEAIFHGNWVRLVRHAWSSPPSG